MRSLRWRRPAMEVLYLLTESVAWFIVLIAFATAMERAFLDQMEQEIVSAVSVGQLADPARALEVARMIRETTVGTAGPSVVAVVLAAACGFYLMRLFRRLEIGGGLGAALLIGSTIVGVNVLLHVAVAGDLRIWDASTLVDLVVGPEVRFQGREGLDAFVEDPRIGVPHGDALALTLTGLTMVWVRFVFAARGEITLERMARSFTASFIVVLIALIFARSTGVAVSSAWAVVQFIVGMTGLAVANHHRAVPTEEAASRTTAWLTSVGATMALLGGSAAMIGLLAYLRFGVLLDVAGTILIRIVAVILIIVITPIYWLLDRIVGLIFGERGDNDLLPQIARFDFSRLAGEEGEEGGFGFPEWATNSLKFLFIVAAFYLAYRIGRRLIAPRRAAPTAVSEVRTRGSDGAGVGQLLADLLRFGGRDHSDDWLGRHRVYALYGRMLSVGAARGLARLPTETPSEYATTAERALSAPIFTRVGTMFDHARYGRRYPASADVRAVAVELDAWDKANPPTEEIRERIRGARQMTADEELNLQIQRAKETVRDGRYDEPLV